MFLLALQSTAWSATWYVNNQTGNDTCDGASAEPKGDGVHGPFATIVRGVSALATSDRLEIAKTSRPYREMLQIVRTGGTPDKPLVVDGHGATIDGLDVIPAADWKAETDGTFSIPFTTKANKLERSKDVMAWIGSPQIWFVDGQPAPNARSAEDLARTPGGFYWNKRLHRLYFRPPVGKRIQELSIEVPVRSTGITVHADYVVVQNLRSTHSLNDGVGTANCVGVVLRNVEGSANCDQGFSAHDGAVNAIEDSRFERNAGSGICDVGNSVTIFRRCVVAHNTYESGAYFMTNGLHILRDCMILDNDDGPQVLISGDGWVQLENTVVRGKAGVSVPAILSQGGNISLKRCTVADCTVGVQMDPAKGLLHVTSSIFTRCAQALLVVPRGAESRFTSNFNGFHLGAVEFGGVRFTQRTWAEYQRISRQDARSLTGDPQFADRDLLALPADSPYLKAGERGNRIGAERPAPVAAGVKPLPFHSTSAHHFIETDVSQSFADDIADFMEIMFAAYMQVFSDIQATPASRLCVRILKNREDYVAEVGEKLAWTGGVYRGPALGIVTCLGKGTPTHVKRVLQHEGFHQFFRIFIGGSEPWIGEGLATYFGSVIIEGDKIIPGAIPAQRLKPLQNAIAQGKASSLKDLIAVTRREWNEDTAEKEHSAEYGEVMLLVHFLLHGRSDQKASPLNNYLLLLKKGARGEDALVKAFGMSLSEVEKSWRDYVLQLKPYEPPSCTRNLTRLAMLVQCSRRMPTPPRTMADLHAQAVSGRIKGWRMRYADGREVTPSSAEEIEIWFHCPEAGAASPIAYELVPPASGSACPDIICRRHGRYLLRASVEPRPDGKGSYAEVDQERITTPQ